MNELKIIKVAEIRKKLAAIPGKLIMSGLLLFGFYYFVLGRDMDAVWAYFSQKPEISLMTLVVVYGIVSYVYFFIKLIGSGILGLVAAIAFVAIMAPQVAKLNGESQIYLLGAMLLGGPVLDLIQLFRYLSLRNDVIHAQEERAEAAYGRGYDHGYGEGYDRAMEDRGSRRGFLGYREEPDEDDEFRVYGRDYVRVGSSARREESMRMRGSRREYIEEQSYEDDYYEDDYDEGYYEEPYEESRYEEPDEYEDWDAPAPGFFGDCKDEAAIKRRYRDLCKVYHPDSGNGSADIFYEITQQYNELMKP